MKIGRGSRRSIRYSVFIGILVGSIFSGSGAFAADWNELSSAINSGSEVTLELNGIYVAPESINSSTYFGSFSGTLNGNGATISGLIAPLFDDIGGSVSNLNLETHIDGVSGNGVLANSTSPNTTIDGVQVTGVVNGGVSEYVGGVVGLAGLGGTISNSTFTGEVISITDYAGGLVGESNGFITDSSTSGSIDSTSRWVGGLVGNSNGQVTNSSSSMTVSADQDYVGGLIGATTATVLNSFASGDVASDPPGVGSGVGGLIGYVNGASEIVRVTASYASGSVYGYLNVGGLIGVTGGTVTLEASYATGSTEAHTGSYAGGLIGYAGLNSGNTDISDSYATGSTTGASSNVGGLVGYSEGTMSISQSYATGTVAGTSNVGGLIGHLSAGEIVNSYSTGAVTGSGEYIGGFIGDAYGTIEDSFATGAVTGTGEFDHGVGGFAGYLGGYLTNTYATGDVNGFNEVGGLVGSTGSSTSITDSYASGDVNGTDEVGGLVGMLDEYHSITGSYATGDVTGDNKLGGLVGTALLNSTISNSYAIGNVTASNVGDDIGGLVGDLGMDATITNSYARGNVSGDDNIGGLVGYQDTDAFIAGSYATGDVTATGTGSNGDAGGLVGDAQGAIKNSHASGDVSGDFDTGGLVGDLGGAGSITNSYATGNVRATGTDGNWDNGWGGLVGESSGLISNSYATGNVVADYNYGSLIGFLMRDLSLGSQIVNSFATGSNSSANNGVQIYEGIYDEYGDFVEDVLISELGGLGGFVGCTATGNDNSANYSCLDSFKSFPDTNPSILSVVNTVDVGDETAFEIVACKNDGLPLLSELIASYTNTCTSNPTAALVSAVLASAVQLNPKFNLLESTTLRLFLYLAGDDTIRITVEDFVVLGVTGVNKANLPILLKLLKDVDLLTLDLKTINKNVKIADEILKKKKKK
jgi:hypothetical protein